MSGTDHIKHSGEELAGKAKEVAGETTGNEDLAAKGRAEQTAANVKQAGDNVKDAGADIKDAFKK
jgi:uncharacterized protein YjbJ (UPF0337 family)